MMCAAAFDMGIDYKVLRGRQRMKSLLIYLKNYKKETVLAPLFKLLEASFELLVPLVMAAGAAG